jgi:hypothetical protein
MQELGVANEAVIDVRRVSKSFERGTRVLDDVSFSVGRREMVASSEHRAPANRR